MYKCIFIQNKCLAISTANRFYNNLFVPIFSASLAPVAKIANTLKRSYYCWMLLNLLFIIFSFKNVRLEFSDFTGNVMLKTIMKRLLLVGTFEFH